MNKSFFRKVGFGLGVDESIPSDPLEWSISQIEKLPKLHWSGPIYSLKEMMEFHGKYNYQDRRVLRKKFKNSRKDYKRAKKLLKYQTGHYYFEPLWLYIRHNEAINGSSPVFQRFLHFWGNHFAIQQKDAMYSYDVGPYHREIIAPAMLKNIEDLVYDVTISWAMIHNLDNSKSIGPNSPRAFKYSTRGKSANLNENHGRELLELHTVSPNAGYTQNDVIDMSKVMSGWMHRIPKMSSKIHKREENVPVHFIEEYHDSGPFNILGKKYVESFGTKAAREMLRKVIKDLVKTPACIEFISKKLCNHFITQYPSDEIVNSVISAWKNSKGDLKIIHSEVLKQAYKFSYLKKFQQPETWLLQFIKMSGLDYFPKDMTYNFETMIPRDKDRVRRICRNLGQLPFRPLQPNGWSDFEEDWLSPEFLFRRIGILNALKQKGKLIHLDKSYLDRIIELNFDNVSEIKTFLEKVNNNEESVALFSSKWMLKT
ncbi:MAG: DUF1800 family protein [Alphaproteobacteria bacterium]|nr:MAG: DUF1800 family protein [Alphaproteobacteria bacterium]